MSLKNFHEAIKTTLQAQLSHVNVQAYRPTLGKLPTPCALIELTMAEEGEDRGEERTPHNVHWSVHCVLSTRTENIELEIRDFAAQVFSLVRRNQWGMNGSVGLPKDLNYMPGMLKPGEHGFDSFVVSWQQVIYLGESIWNSEGVTPHEVIVNGEQVFPDN